MKKYEFTGETKRVELWNRTATLHRIKATVEFGFVKVGELGGWIEKEENLSHEGKACYLMRIWWQCHQFATDIEIYVKDLKRQIN